MKLTALFTANRTSYSANARLPILRHFIDRDWAVYVAGNRDQFAEKLEQAGCSFVEVPFASGGFKWRNDIAAIKRIRHIIQDIRPHIIHNSNPKPIMLGTYFGRRIMKDHTHIFNTMTGLGYPYRMKKGTVQRVSNFIYSQVLDKANHTIFENEKDRRRFVDNNLVSASLSSTIVSSGVDIKRFSPKKQRSYNSNLHLIFIGRLLRQKGLCELIDAVSILQKSGHNISVNVYGEIVEDHPDGLKKDYVEDQVRKGIITFHGFVKHIENALQNADVLVLPSSYGEGVPRVVLEAASMALPAIVCESGWVSGVVKNGETGFVVEPRSASSLADAIMKFVSNRSLVQSMGNAAREHMKKEFEQSKIMDRYWALYEDHLNQKI